jgi:hypothetical protein
VKTLPVAVGLAVAAAIGLAALTLALNLTSDLGSSHYEDAVRAGVSAYVLVFLGIGLAAAARGTLELSRRGFAAAVAGTGATALAVCIAGVVWAYRARGLDITHAYALVAFAGTLAFAALALAVLGAPFVRRTALAVAALLGLAAVVFVAVALFRAAGDPLFSLGTTAAVLAAAAALSARQPDAGEEPGRR